MDVKILYIAKFQPSTGTYGGHENDVLSAFRELEIPTGCMLYRQSKLRSVENNVGRYGYNVLLFSKAEPIQFPRILTWARQEGILTVTWVWDLYWGYRRRMPRQFSADLLFTTDGGHEQKWEENFPQHRVLRQGIPKKHAYIAPRRERYDVGFVGSLAGHPGRLKMLEFCCKNYSFMHLTRTRGDLLNRALSEIRVVVGDSYPSPRYWSNRIYEMLGRGAFFLHPETPGMEEEFQDGVHYVSFRRGDLADLRSKIDYYLNHPEERLRIAKAGFEHTARNYTYHTRCRELLRVVRALS